MTQTHYIDIPLIDLIESSTNPRQGFDGIAMKELTASVKEHGILQPLVIRPLQTTNGYEIVTGARRFRAAKAAGLTTVPAVIRELTIEQALTVQIVENLQREDVTAIEEAHGYKTLQQGNDVVAIAKLIGKSVAHVYGRLQLLKVSKAVQAAVLDGRITPSHAALMVPLSPKEQDEFVDWIGNDNVSVDDLKQQIKREKFKVLSGAPWKLIDATLVPKAGPCSACPKNSGVNPEIRAAVEKKDICTDRTCFQHKLDVYINRTIKEADKAGTPLVLLSSMYSPHVKGALRYDQWTSVAHKKTKQRGIIIDGDRIGRVVYFIIRQGEQSKESQSWRRSEAKLRKRVKFERDWRGTVATEIGNKVRSLTDKDLVLIDKALLGDVDLKILGKVKTIEGRILVGALAKDIDVQGWGIRKPAMLLSYARRFKINVKKIQNEARDGSPKDRVSDDR